MRGEEAPEVNEGGEPLGHDLDPDASPANVQGAPPLVLVNVPPREEHRRVARTQHEDKVPQAGAVERVARAGAAGNKGAARACSVARLEAQALSKVSSS